MEKKREKTIFFQKIKKINTKHENLKKKKTVGFKCEKKTKNLK